MGVIKVWICAVSAGTHTCFSMLMRTAVVHKRGAIVECYINERPTCWPSLWTLINKVKILIKLKQKISPSINPWYGWLWKFFCFIIPSLSRLLPINSFNGSFELWPAQSWFHRSVNLHYCISNNSLAWLGWDDSSPQPASITVRKKDLEPSQTRSDPSTPHIQYMERDTPGQQSSIQRADEAIATAP